MTDSEGSLLYRRIARSIEAQVANGALRPGDRAPSVRVLSRSAGVSIATVTQAYLQLEQRGLLEARPRSGFFVARPVPRPPEPAAGRVRSVRPHSVAEEAIDTMLESHARDDLVALGSAVSSSAHRCNTRLNAICRALLRDEPDLPNRMIAPPGDPELRREIAKRMGRLGAPVDPSAIVVTAGALEAIVLGLRVLCRAGDTVLVETPTYFGILQAIEYLELKVVEVPNRPGTGIDVEAVERMAARTRLAAAVLMPNFNNPTGALTSDSAKRALLELLGGRGVPIIEDDVYADLHHGAARPKPLRAFPGGERVITCGSVSKTLALGYRLGWAIAPDHAAEIARMKYCSSVAVPSLQQRVVARYLASGGYERHLRALREELAPNVARFSAAIVRHFPEGTRVSAPEGGIVLWVQLPGGADGLALFRHALAERIGIAPGLVFSATAGYRDFIRVSAGAAWTPAVEDALARLGRLAGRGVAGR